MCKYTVTRQESTRVILQFKLLTLKKKTKSNIYCVND